VSRSSIERMSTWLGGGLWAVVAAARHVVFVFLVIWCGPAGGRGVNADQSGAGAGVVGGDGVGAIGGGDNWSGYRRRLVLLAAVHTVGPAGTGSMLPAPGESGTQAWAIRRPM
jgi:hypothetical protein